MTFKTLGCIGCALFAWFGGPVMTQLFHSTSKIGSVAASVVAILVAMIFLTGKNHGKTV